MSKRKYTEIYLYITRITMTAILFTSFYILGQVALLKYCPAANPGIYGAIPAEIESVLAALAVYLMFSLIAVKFRPE